MAHVLSRTDEALTPDELGAFLRKRLGDGLVETRFEYDLFTVVLTNEAYLAAAILCRDERLLAFDMFDCSFGVDEREDGFSVATILYSTTKGVRICLKTLAQGGREAPVVPSLAPVYPGANWMERETWDMFGIEFEGHPGLAPRILTVENFEGWPLRKDFYLTSRVAKPWPGVKEPAELDDEGNVIERVPGPGEAPGPTALDKAMADQAKLANPSAAPEAVEAASDSGRVVESDKQRVEEAVEEAGSDARARAEEQRKAQAEARARKAAERAHADEVTTPAEDVAEVPDAAGASPEAGTQGGPPAEGPAPDAGTVGEGHEASVEGGLSETVERARGAGSVDEAAPEAPVEPEGREVDPDAEPQPDGQPDDGSDGEERR